MGAALKNKFADGTVKREDLFITGKIWCHCFRPENIEKCLDDSLKKLGLEYLDLVLLHSPMPLQFHGLEQGFPFADGKPLIDDDVHYTDTWKGLVKIYKETDKLKAIGVSNYNQFQIEKLAEVSSDIMPAINQVEMHPYLNQADLIETCSKYGIII